MHLNHCATHPMMATLLRQSASRLSVRAASCLRHFNSKANGQLPSLPIYSIDNQWSSKWPLSILVRRANTSSGQFAPLTSNQRATPATSANSSVFEDCDHLPSLPVPNLPDVMEMLKESVSPVAMNSAEFVQTLQLIEEFSRSAGPKLDLLLRIKANQVKNWMTHDWWTEQVYLRSRHPLVINSNPSMVYPTFPFEVNSQRSLITVVSQLISGIIDFKLSLIHGYNPEASNSADETRLDPNLCYHQYQSIFGFSRIPGEHVDQQHKLPANTSGEDQPFNLIVSFRGKFYEVQLQSIDNEKDRIEKLEGILDKIIMTGNQESATSNEDSQLEGAGVLTAMNRNDWARAYKLLDKDSVESIRDGQFLVCLDTIAPEIDDDFPKALLHSPAGSEQHMAALGRQVLHADQANIGNRWFDKSFQLIVVADENAERLLGAGINYEHSFGEGTIVTKMIEYSFDKTTQKHNSTPNGNNNFARQQVSSNQPATFRQLPMFNESHYKDIATHIKQARQNFHSQVAQFDMSYMRYKQYGSNSIKSWRFSPDSWFQVALELAYYNVHKRLGPCYESASTRRFAFGRTETIRSLTKQVAQFCLEPSYATMQAAVQSHKSYAIAAGNGNAIDRTLMGYRMAFNELKTRDWRWGLPDLRKADTRLNEESPKKILELIENTNQQEQGIDVERLFSEEELQTIYSFFNSELINRSKKFALSTSQVQSIHPNICMSYGPLLADGYGCCYNITGQQIVASITANSSNQSFSCEVEQLNEGIQDSLDKMRDLVEEQRSGKKS